MKCDMSRRRTDAIVASDHLSVAKPLRPEDLDRRVTHHGIYPSLPASPGVPWSAYVKSQRVGSRSVSSSTEASDSDQARCTTQRIIQHTRSLPTDSPIPHIPTDREYKSDSGPSDQYTVRTPIVSGVSRPSYEGYMTEHDDYATLGGITSAPSNAGMFVNHRTKSISSRGSPIPKDNFYVPSAVSTSSHPIIGESATVFTDMTDTMLKVLDRCMAVNTQARELENSLAENAYAIGQSGQGMTGYLQDPDSYKFTTAQPLYMNTLPKATGIGVPMAESSPVPQVGPTLFRPIPTPRVHDILEPSTNEQARAKYLETQMRHMKSVQLPSSIPSSDDKPLEENSLSGGI